MGDTESLNVIAESIPRRSPKTKQKNGLNLPKKKAFLVLQFLQCVLQPEVSSPLNSDCRRTNKFTTFGYRDLV